MRAIITGGTGLIGRALAASLAGDGWETVVLSRTPDRVSGMPGSVRLARWDARAAGELVPWIEGADVVINLAGENPGSGRWTATKKQRILDSRIAAGHAVVQAVAAVRRRPAVLVQASAVGYYGPRGAEPVPESAPPGTDWMARVAINWEASTEPVEAQGVRRVVIRTGLVLSSEGGALPRMLLPFRWFVGGPLGSGRQPFPWIHIADEVGAIRFLMDTPQAHGAFNLAAPHPPTQATFARALGRVMGRPAVIPAPAFALRLALGEMASMVLTGQRAVPERLTALGYTFRFTEAEAALADLLSV